MYNNYYRAVNVCGGFSTTMVSLLSVAGYVLFALGLMTLANRKNMPNAWLAWIPIANLYILGKIVKRVNIGSFDLNRLELWLPLSALIPAVLGWIPIFGVIVMIALAVFYGFVLYRLFSMYKKEQAALYTLLSIVLSAIGVYGLLVFLIRNEPEQV